MEKINTELERLAFGESVGSALEGVQRLAAEFHLQIKEVLLPPELLQRHQIRVASKTLHVRSLRLAFLLRTIEIRMDSHVRSIQLSLSISDIIIRAIVQR